MLMLCKNNTHSLVYSEQLLTLVKAEKFKTQLLCDTYSLGIQTTNSGQGQCWVSSTIKFLCDHSLTAYMADPHQYSTLMAFFLQVTKITKIRNSPQLKVSASCQQSWYSWTLSITRMWANISSDSKQHVLSGYMFFFYSGFLCLNGA